MRAPAGPNATEALTASPAPSCSHIYFDIFYDSLFGGFSFPATQMKLAARFLDLFGFFLSFLVFVCTSTHLFPRWLVGGQNVNNQAKGEGNFIVEMVDGWMLRGECSRLVQCSSAQREGNCIEMRCFWYRIERYVMWIVSRDFKGPNERTWELWNTAK